jgi:hypothetical protein
MIVFTSCNPQARARVCTGADLPSSPWYRIPTGEAVPAREFEVDNLL